MVGGDRASVTRISVALSNDGRDMVRDGASPVIAAVVSVFAVCIGAIHFLLRPHLFTFAFVYLTMRACQAQHERSGWAVLKVTFYTLILANVHGGFVALPLIVATAGIGHALSGAWDATRKANTARFGMAFLASCVAALVNPYGIALYGHVAGLLVSSGVTSLIIEYQPPHFGTPEANVLEWVLLALIGLPAVSASRIDRYRLCHVLVWLHLALDVDPERAAVRSGGGACARDSNRRLAAGHARRMETPGATGPFSRRRDVRRAVSGDGRCDLGRV